MATIINNPGNSGDGSSGAGLWIGIIVVILLLVVFFVYGLPAIRGNGGGTTIKIPDTINVNTGGGSGGGTGGGSTGGGSGY